MLLVTVVLWVRMKRLLEITTRTRMFLAYVASVLGDSEYVHDIGLYDYGLVSEKRGIFYHSVGDGDFV